MGITVSVSDDINTMVVGFSGHITKDEWPDFKSKCLSMPLPSKIMLDFRNLDEINVVVLAMVLMLRKRLPRKTDVITVLACNERIREFVNSMDMEYWFKLPEDSKIQQKSAVCSQVFD